MQPPILRVRVTAFAVVVSLLQACYLTTSPRLPEAPPAVAPSASGGDVAASGQPYLGHRSDGASGRNTAVAAAVMLGIVATVAIGVAVVEADALSHIGALSGASFRSP